MQPLIGLVIILILITNMVVLPTFLILTALLMAIIPIPSLRAASRYFTQIYLPPIWTDINIAALKLNRKLKWDVQGPGPDVLDKKGWYFLISNHRSAVDILVIETLFNKKIPRVKFFMKRSLIWMIPVTGLACWFMGYPFVHRATKRQIKKNPSLKGRDIKNIQEACQRFEKEPTTLLSFLEGTRYTHEKHRKKRSPYRHLLPIHAGSFGIVNYELRDVMHHIINVTIVYPGHETVSLWDFISGQIERVVVRYEVLTIPQDLQGDWLKDRAFRKRLRTYINQLWQEKDQLIESIIAEHTSTAEYL